MENLTTNYNIKLEILTPVHIGGGKEKDWSKGIDFVHHEGKIYVLDQKKVFLDLLEMENQKEGTYLSKKDTYLSKINSGNLVGVEKFIVDEFGDNLEDYATKIIDSDMPESASEIKSLIRNGQGKPYIPGSSIKGALASVIFNYLYQSIGVKQYTKFTYKDLMGDFERSIMRFIRPYDLIMSTDKDNMDTEIHSVKIFNLYNKGVWKSDYKDNIPITLETFAHNNQQNYNFRLSIADGLGTLIGKKEKYSSEKMLPTYYKQIIEQQTIGQLFNMINDYSYKYLLKEIEFFEKYNQAKNSPEIIATLYDLLYQTVNQTKSCLLRLAHGSGFYGITGDWRFENHLHTIENPDKENKDRRYKTRKIIGDNLMGFVQLTLPDGVADIEFTEKIGVAANPKQYFLDTNTKTTVDKSPEIENTTIPQDISTEPIATKIEVAFATINNNTIFTAELVKISTKKEVLLHIQNQQIIAELVLEGLEKLRIFQLNEIIKVKVHKRSGDNRIIQVKLL